MRHLALIFCLALILSACVVVERDSEPTPTIPPIPGVPTATTEPTATEREEDPTATSTAEPTATNAPAPTVAQSLPTATPATATATMEPEADDVDISELVRQITHQAAEVRGLEVLHEIDLQVVTSEQMGQDLIALMQSEYSQEDADLDRDLLWMLRLLDDRNYDYMQLQMDLQSGAVLGYYNTETKELFVASDGDEITPGQKLTMAHEIIHALQDQHFALDRMDEDMDFEAQTGFTALVEGEASFTEVVWGLEYLSFDEILQYVAEIEDADVSVYDRTPRYVLETLLFPYNLGYVFVEALHTEGGYDLVDAAFMDPPVSSEQILHPEKYLQEPRDMPLEVDVPDLFSILEEDWELVYDGSLGELDLFLLLEINGVADGTVASEGWGGTWFELYRSDEDMIVTLATRWDTETDASEFHEALLETMSGYEQEGELWFDGKRYHAIVANGDAVTLTTSTDRDTLIMALAVQ